MWTREATKLQSAEEFLKPCFLWDFGRADFFLTLSGVYFKDISPTLEAWAF